MNVEHVVASNCVLGEGPLWFDGALWWVDIKAPALWRFAPESGASKSWEMPERLGFIAPRAGGGFVGGFKSGLAHIALEGDAAKITPLCDYPRAGQNDRLNDGAVDAQGRLWFGSMDDDEVNPTGHLHLYDGSGAPQRRDGPYIVTNGPAISPDGRRLYHVSSADKEIWALDVNAQGEVKKRALFMRFEDPAWGHPDGAICDAQGHIWVAHWDGGRISRFAPDGALERQIALPVSRVTKCAFGGPDLDRLYITTAAIGVEEPMAGDVFAVDAGVKGLPCGLFKG